MLRPFREFNCPPNGCEIQRYTFNSVTIKIDKIGAMNNLLLTNFTTKATITFSMAYLPFRRHMHSLPEICLNHNDFDFKFQ